jgi:hypothetical protein
MLVRDSRAEHPELPSRTGQQLEARASPLSPEEEQLSQLLTLLIEEFEDQHYQLQAATPVEILRELMEINTLNQSDLTDVFGNRSVVSECSMASASFQKHTYKSSVRGSML